MARAKITVETINAAMDTPAVRRALRAKAARALPRAQRLAIAAGAKAFAASLRTEEGTRPGAKSEGGLRRPFARVIGDATGEVRQADAGGTMTRRSIMRRASRA